MDPRPPTRPPAALRRLTAPPSRPSPLHAPGRIETPTPFPAPPRSLGRLPALSSPPFLSARRLFPLPPFPLFPFPEAILVVLRVNLFFFFLFLLLPPLPLPPTFSSSFPLPPSFSPHLPPLPPSPYSSPPRPPSSSLSQRLNKHIYRINGVTIECQPEVSARLPQRRQASPEEADTLQSNLRRGLASPRRAWARGRHIIGHKSCNSFVPNINNLACARIAMPALTDKQDGLRWWW